MAAVLGIELLDHLGVLAHQSDQGLPAEHIDLKGTPRFTFRRTNPGMLLQGSIVRRRSGEDPIGGLGLEMLGLGELGFELGDRDRPAIVRILALALDAVRAGMGTACPSPDIDAMLGLARPTVFLRIGIAPYRCEQTAA